MDDRVGRRHHLRRVVGGVQMNELGMERLTTTVAIDLPGDVQGTRAAVAEQEQRHNDQQHHILTVIDTRAGVVFVVVDQSVIVGVLCIAATEPSDYDQIAMQLPGSRGNYNCKDTTSDTTHTSMPSYRVVS